MQTVSGRNNTFYYENMINVHYQLGCLFLSRTYFPRGFVCEHEMLGKTLM